MAQKKRFRVALSFSGKKRTYVAELASILADRFDKDQILYDKFHAAEFARADLVFHLPELYHQQCDLVVAILCPDYESAEWCGLEWGAIFDLVKKRETDKVMLCRFELAKAKGLFGEGYLDLDEISARGAARAILERLALIEHQPRDYYLKAPDQGSESPDVDELDSDGTQLPPADTPQASTKESLPELWNKTIGRDTEIEKVLNLVQSSRLVTIVGTGGSGKTRIAIEVADRLKLAFPDGVFFIDLASLAAVSDEDARVPSRIAVVAGVREQAIHPPLRALGDHFAQRTALLLLDNCEHVVSACKSTAGYLIKLCPHLKILATSRVCLFHPAERHFQLGRLALPEAADHINPDDAMHIAAVQLFVERVREDLPDYVLDKDSVGPVAKLCQVLDGLPLAIEVAARSLAVNSVDQMNQESQNLLDSLGEIRAGELRSWDSLAAVFQWSFDLLKPEDREFAKAMSEFDGGWTAEAANGIRETFAQKQIPVQRHITRLMENSLIYSADSNRSKRFRFYEPIRQFVQSQVSEQEKAAYQKRHADYFASFLSKQKNDLLGANQAFTLDLIQAEVDNIRASLRFTIANQDAETALRLIAAVWRFCEMRGYLAEGREWARQVLALPKAAEYPGLQAAVLSGTGILAYRQGDYDDAEKMFDQCRLIEAELGNEAGLANALNDLALVVREKGQFAEAHSLLRRSFEIERRLQNDRQMAVLLNNMGSTYIMQGLQEEAIDPLKKSVDSFRKSNNLRDCAFPLTHLANIAIFQSDFVAARAYCEESLSICRVRSDIKGVADALRMRSRLNLESGDLDCAVRDAEESLKGARSVGDKKSVVETLSLFASVHIKAGDGETGVLQYAAHESETNRSGLPLKWPLTIFKSRDLALAQSNTSEAEFRRAWAKGFPMSVDEAIEVGRAVVRGTTGAI